MKNPYDVLGVSQNASDEQIREAYRLLARRLSDEQENGNAVKLDERMRELDWAYDNIIMTRNTNYNGGQTYQKQPFQQQQQYSGQSTYNSSVSEFDDIREKIRAGRFDDAEILLDGYPEYNRNAEWHFLKGNIQYRKGWLEEASGNYAAACNMDPGNREYKAAYENMNNSSSGGYRTERSRSSGSSCSACDMCSGLICADCCCECMGGDLIRCC